MGKYSQFFILHVLAMVVNFTLPAQAQAAAVGGGNSSLNCIQTSDRDAQQQEETCSIAVGVIDVRDFDFAPRSQVGNETVLQAKEGSSPNQVRIVPLKKGTTSVLIDDHQGGHRQRIIYNITTNDLSSKVASIRQLLSDIEGITIHSLDDKIVIDGELIVPRDFDRISMVQKAYEDSVLNLVTLSKISREAIAKRMQKEINEYPGGANVSVKVVNDVFFVTGKVDSQYDRDHAELIAKTYLPDNMSSASLGSGALSSPIKNRAALQIMLDVEEQPPAPNPKMVRVTYHFVEIGKNFLKSSFFKWTPFLSQGAGIQIGPSTTGGVGASGGSSFVGTITNLFPQLQSGTQGGFARVLDSAVTLGIDNEAMTVNRTEKVPYVQAIVNGVPVAGESDAGINISVTPSILGEDKIKLKTQFNFKAFEPGGAGGISATQGTQIQNTVIVKSGDSAVLGGLVSNNIAKNIGQDPTSSGSGGSSSGGASATSGSALFNLLRSKSFQNSKTQFVVFITPKIIEDAAEGTADIKAKIISGTKKRQRTIQ